MNITLNQSEIEAALIESISGMVDVVNNDIVFSFPVVRQGANAGTNATIEIKPKSAAKPTTVKKKDKAPVKEAVVKKESNVTEITPEKEVEPEVAEVEDTNSNTDIFGDDSEDEAETENLFG